MLPITFEWWKVYGSLIGWYCTYKLKDVTGDVVNAVEHLSNVVSLCGQPQHLLHELKQTLPPQTSNSETSRS